MAKTRKVNKARRKHFCNHCRGSVKIGESYEYKRVVLVGDFGIASIKDKECKHCIDSRVKRKYKQQQHDIRAKKRRENCPDADFQMEWQGGWSDGAPDGGDCRSECHKCNLHCVD